MTGRSDDRRYNVVLVVLDTVRAAQLGLYGRDRDPMPALANFAEDATVFDRAYTNAPWTVPAHASLFTGALPSEHGCHGGSLQFDTEYPALAETFAERGYQTVGVSNDVWISDHFGFDAGFDTFYKEWQLFRQSREIAHTLKSQDRSAFQFARTLVRGNPLINVLNGVYGKYWYRRSDYGADRTTADLESLLANREEPFFTFVNYMEGHAPYQKRSCTDEFLPAHIEDPTRYVELSGRSCDYHVGDVNISEEDFAIIESLYDGELRYLDRRLQRLFDVLRDRDLLSESIVVILGDHGENIGDHGLMAHRFSVHDTLLHVPLVVRHPEADHRIRVSEPVDLTDLHRWLLDATDGSSYPGEMPSTGPVVSEYLATDYAPETNRSDFSFPGSEYDRRYVAVLTDSHKFVRADDGREYLYATGDGPDFELDGREVPTPDQTVPELASSLRAHCSGFGHGGSTTDDNRSAVESHLRKLGYM